MKLTLILSFLNICLVNYTNGEQVRPPAERTRNQPPKNRIYILSESLRRKFRDDSNVKKVSGTKIDEAGDNQLENYPVKLRKFNSFSAKSSTNISRKMESSIQSVVRPTLYIRHRGNNELAGPEGKIAEVLVKSINRSLVINEIEQKGLVLNLMPVSAAGSWSLAYHPYRKLPLVPVIHGGSNTETQVTFCLLAMLTIMIIMLLQVMRNLISINDSKFADASRFVRCLTMPKGWMGGVESFFYLCLVFTFFMNLGIILEIVFREKYGKDKFEKIRAIEDIEKLNLKPIFSTKECLRELVIKQSNGVYCIVFEDFGKEVIRRYGRDGRKNMIQLVDSFHLKFEWRGMHLDSDRHLERFNSVQLKLLQSGLLDKWYNDEIIVSLGDSENDMKKLRTTWSVRIRDESARLKKFVYFLGLMVINGCFMGLFMFVAEYFILRSHVTGRKERYIEREATTEST